MIGMKKKGDNLFVAYVPKTLYYEAMETNALERDQLIEVLLAHGCHQVDIADAFHGLEIGWEFREGAWHPPHRIIIMTR